MEYFTTDEKHYLAVANFHDDAAECIIYQWNGHQFVVFQNIETNSATSLNFFRIMKEMFLAITNYYDGTTYSINSVIYKWKDNQFKTFQEIGTEGAYGSTAFVINNESFVVFANSYNSQHSHSVKSTIFKWSGSSFVKLQSLQTYGARDVKSFNMNGHTFLAFANFQHGEEYNIYKWNGSRFVRFESIPTRGAQAWHPFVTCGQTFLGVANFRGNQSVVYQTSGEQIIKYREISTQQAHGMTSFEYQGHVYLAIANFGSNGKHNIKSTLYKWI